MKSLFFLSLALILTGAGCTSDPSLLDISDLSVTTSSGSTITQKIDTNSATTTEDGVVVTEIMLGDPADVELDMESGNFFFSPSEITVSQGDTVAITFTKNSGTHTFVIDELNAKFEIAEGETYYFTVPEEAGSYAFYCDIGSHRSFGMEGTLIVK
ncbi:cupredoxin domain-containing protein [Candidatus Uhrbacteria bacterium]|nr:cupredoxin domain-containing protein [Candidatus Uhrbacteria bacterium]